MGIRQLAGLQDVSDRVREYFRARLLPGLHQGYFLDKAFVSNSTMRIFRGNFSSIPANVTTRTASLQFDGPDATWEDAAWTWRYNFLA